MIVINNIIWNLYIVDSNDINLIRDDGGYTIGVTDWNQKAIFISKNIDYDKFKKVLMHEITHAFIFSYGFPIDIYAEECMCSFVENYAQQIINKTNEILGEMV